jgi:hypothetical protein
MYRFSRLTDYLKTLCPQDVVLSVDEIVAVLGESLPTFSQTYPHRFWCNSDSSTYAKIWKRAGYLASYSSSGQVRFHYDPPMSAPSEKRPPARFDSAPDVHLPPPSSQEVTKALADWRRLEKYVVQESALSKLFLETYPKNDDLDEILVKVSCLNDFYATNIKIVARLAAHILALHIDERLAQGDESLVAAIGRGTEGSSIYFYSFASKYCSHHRPEFYPIYDDYVKRVLLYFGRRDHFAAFSPSDLKEYPRFKAVVLAFREHYGLEAYSLKELDHYLWQLGKAYFPKYEEKGIHDGKRN